MVALEALVARQGIDGFYYATEAREACCAVRKVDPLAARSRARGGWITGARATSPPRRDGGVIGFEEAAG